MRKKLQARTNVLTASHTQIRGEGDWYTGRERERVRHTHLPCINRLNKVQWKRRKVHLTGERIKWKSTLTPSSASFFSSPSSLTFTFYCIFKFTCNRISLGPFMDWSVQLQIKRVTRTSQRGEKSEEKVFLFIGKEEHLPLPLASSCIPLLV